MITRPYRLMCALAFAAGCGEDVEAPPAEPLVTAETATVAVGDFTPTIRATATVTPRAGAVARLAAPAPSRVTGIQVGLGDRVAAGQALVTLDGPLFTADSASAAAQVSAAEAGWERAVRLQGEGILPVREVEQRAAELAQARATAAASRRNAELAVLRAPIAGVVTRLDAALGAAVDPSMPLVEVVDPSALELSLALLPEQASGLRVGMRGHFMVAEGESVAFVVTAIGAVVDPSNRTIAIRARPSSPRGLRVGQSVAAVVELPPVAASLMIPAAALVPEGDSATVVFTVDAGHVVHRTPVTVGVRADSLVTILTGLEVGETVVTAGAYGMVDGATLGQAARRPE